MYHCPHDVLRAINFGVPKEHTVQERAARRVHQLLTAPDFAQNGGYRSQDRSVPEKNATSSS